MLSPEVRARDLVRHAQVARRTTIAMTTLERIPSGVAAPTTTVAMITRISITAMAEPSAQFCAVWNWLATSWPTM